MAIGRKQLLCPASYVPLWLESRQNAGDLFEADTVRSFVRPRVRRHFDTTTGHHLCNDLGYVAHAIVVSGAANIECLIKERVLGCLKCGSHRPGHEIIKHYVEANARRHSIGSCRV